MASKSNKPAFKIASLLHGKVNGICSFKQILGSFPTGFYSHPINKHEAFVILLETLATNFISPRFETCKAGTVNPLGMFSDRKPADIQ